MKGGSILVAGLALTSGCAANQGLQIRAIPDPAAKLRYSGSLLDVGRAQLSLGNPGTALETFRKLLREQPANPDAFAGIAACYQAMGRYDLEQANYEFALAYAPHDRGLLTALASSLDRQGQSAQAANIYAEIAQAAAPPATAVQPNVTPVDVPRLSSVTIDLPAVPAVAATAHARAVPVNAAAVPAIVNAIAAPVPSVAAPIAVNAFALPAMITAAAPPPSTPAAVPMTVNATALPAMIAATAPVLPAKQLAMRTAAVAMVARAAAPVASVKPVEAPLAMKAAIMPAFVTAAPLAARPTVPAPAPARVEALPAAVALPQRPAQLQPAEHKPRPVPIAQAAIPAVREPYLERLSTGEVALVTTSQPLWRSPAAPRTAMASVQWLPLNRTAARPAIQILNAARTQGLAAHTREALVDRGWRKLAIGDAREVRERSLVLYSPSHKVLAWRLAAQLRCKAAEVDGRERLVVLVGRDAAQRRASSLRT